MATETGFGRGAKKRTVRTPKTVVYGVVTASTAFEVAQANVRCVLTKPSDVIGDITLTYSLKNPRANTASIRPQYSKDGGITFSTMTSAGGDDGVNSLTTSSGGTSHTFKWNTVTNLGIDFKGAVEIRIQAFDLASQGGDFEFSEQHKLNIDNAPLVSTLVSPISSFFDKNETPLLIFIIPNPSEGNSDMHAKLELDSDSGFNSSELQIIESRNDQTGWEYDANDTYNASTKSGGKWLAFPAGGIPIIATAALIGNHARYRIQTPNKLLLRSWNWRITFGGVI